MVYKNFYIGILIIGVSIIGTAYMISWIGFNQEYLHTLIFLHFLFILEFIWLITFVNKTNRMLDRFFSSIKEDGTSIKFESTLEESTFKLLSKRLNNVVETIQKTRIEKENEHYFLKYLVEHINTGIISILNNEKIDLLNNTGVNILGNHELYKVSDLKKFGKQFYNNITKIRTGEHLLTKAIIQNEIKDLSLRASEFKLFKDQVKLISFHDVHQEIEQKEIDAWQKIIRILAHEISSSVSPIRSLSDHLIKLINRSDSKYLNDVKDGVNIIHQRSDGLMNFVSKYRQVTDIPEPILKPISLNEIISDLELISSTEFNLKSSLKIHRPEEEILINADKNLIMQAALNIIRNASEAIQSISNPMIKITGKVNYNATVLEITDNGIGIDIEDLENVFIPFFSTKENGSGIGLAIAKQLINKQGGRIDIQSKPDKGTSVKIYFDLFKI